MQNTRARIRLRYRKDDVLRYIGHRDLLRYVIKLLRRAEVPYALSEGFSPKPKLSFGPALPLGVLADNELLDIELGDGIVPDQPLLREIAGRLAEVSSPRDFVRGLTALAPEDRPVSRVAVASRYLFSDPQAVELLGSALTAGSLPVDDEKKGAMEYAGRVTAHRVTDAGIEITGNNGENALNAVVLARWVAAQAPGGYIPDVTRTHLLDAAGSEL